MDHSHASCGDEKKCCNHNHYNRDEESNSAQEGEREGFLDAYPESIRKRLHVLYKLKEQRAALDVRYRQEIIELERKYLKLAQPFYEDRRKLVTGERDVNEDECSDLRGICEVIQDKKQDGKVDDNSRLLPSSQINGIPEFWLTALRNHPQLASQIFKEDEEALKNLVDIQVYPLEDNVDGLSGFKLVFKFNENPFFTNSELCKSYFLENPVNADFNDLVYDHAEGCEIAWKDGANLCFKTLIKTQRHRTNGTQRTITRREEQPSFFHFFTAPQPKEEESEDAADGEKSDDSNEQVESFEERIQIDYELGDIIKGSIIPNAIDWFTGRALDYNDESNYYDYDEKEGDYDYDEDDCTSSDEQESFPRGRSRN